VNKTRIVVFGDINYDCFVWAERLPRKGETIMGYANGFFSGGKGANQAVQAAKLGAETYFIGKVGDDERGAFLLRELQKNGVNTEYVFIDPETSTGTTNIQVDKNGDNTIMVAPMANLKITEKEIESAKHIIEQADVFMVQLLMDNDITLKCLKWASEAKVITILNPAPAKPISDEFYKYAHFISPNEPEAEYFTGCSQEGSDGAKWREETARWFREKGTKVLLMTLGSNGSYYDDGSQKEIFPCFKVNAIDCTGAGDSFNAAFAIEYIKEKNIKKAITFASAAAALTVQKKGAQASMPVLEQVEKFLLEQGEKYEN